MMAQELVHGGSRCEWLPPSQRCAAASSARGQANFLAFGRGTSLTGGENLTCGCQSSGRCCVCARLGPGTTSKQADVTDRHLSLRLCSLFAFLRARQTLSGITPSLATFHNPFSLALSLLRVGTSRSLRGIRARALALCEFFFFSVSNLRLLCSLTSKPAPTMIFFSS
jgi:hypothetical protein